MPISNYCVKSHSEIKYSFSKKQISFTGPQTTTFASFVIKSQFTYFPVIWMFWSRTLNNFFNHIDQQALGIVHNNSNSSFYDSSFHEMSKEKILNQRGLEHIVEKIYTLLKELLPAIINDLFSFWETPYNPRNFQYL